MIYYILTTRGKNKISNEVVKLQKRTPKQHLPGILTLLIIFVTLCLPLNAYSYATNVNLLTNLKNLMSNYIPRLVDVEVGKSTRNVMILTKDGLIKAKTYPVTVHERITYEDVTTGYEDYGEYLLYLAIEHGLTPEDNSDSSIADLLSWLQQHNVDIKEGYTFTWHMDVALVNGKPYIVYEDSSSEPLEDYLRKTYR